MSCCCCFVSRHGGDDGGACSCVAPVAPRRGDELLPFYLIFGTSCCCSLCAIVIDVTMELDDAPAAPMFTGRCPVNPTYVRSLQQPLHSNHTNLFSRKNPLLLLLVHQPHQPSSERRKKRNRQVNILLHPILPTQKNFLPLPQLHTSTLVPPSKDISFLQQQQAQR